MDHTVLGTEEEYETAILQQPPPPWDWKGSKRRKRKWKKTNGSEPAYEVGVTAEIPQYLQLVQERAVNDPPDGGREEVASAATTEEPMYEPLP